jgi:hypothetical protein
MRTTIKLDDTLFQEAKRLAASEGTSLKALIEEALRLVLQKRRVIEAGERPVLPLSRCSGGVRPGIDLTNSRALEDRLLEP